jgi:hypothetical protein
MTGLVLLEIVGLGPLGRLLALLTRLWFERRRLSKGAHVGGNTLRT